MIVRVTGWLWWFSAFSLLLLALLVVLLRQLLPSVADYKSTLETYLSDLMDAPVAIESIEAHWEGAYPSFTLNNLKALSVSKSADVNVSIHHIDAQIDPLASLTHFYPVFRKLSVDQLEVSFKQADGRWVMSQTDTNQVTASQSSGVARDIIALLSLQPEIVFSDTRISLQPENRPGAEISAVSLTLENSQSQHHLFGALELNMAGERSSAQLAIETGDLPSDPLQAEYQLYAKISNLGQQLLKLDLFDLPWTIRSLDVGTEVWATMKGMQLSSLQGRVNVDQLDFDEKDQLDSITQSHATFFVSPKGQGRYQAVVKDFLLQNSDARIDLNSVVAEVQWLNQQLIPQRVAFSQIDLAQVNGWLLDKPYIPGVANRALQRLNTIGVLENLVVTWPEPGRAINFLGEADLNGVTVGDYFGAPALSNINGKLEFSAKGGSVHLNTTEFGMHFPDLFAQGWHYDTAKGQINWVLDDLEGHEQPVVTVNSGLINLKNENLTAAGRFSMYLPLDERYQSELILMIGLKEANALVAPTYIPPDEVGRSLYEWVDEAIKGGRVEDAMLLLRTDTRSSVERTPVTAQLYVEAQDASVKFLPDWPEVNQTDLQVSVDNGHVAVDAHSGNFLKSKASKVRVTMPADGNVLSVSVDASGNAEDIVTVLTETDLKHEFGSEIEGWQLTGKHETRVQADVPIQSTTPPLIKVTTNLKKGRIWHATEDLDFKKISGLFQYRSKTGIRAKGVKAEFLNSPYRIDIATETIESDVASKPNQQQVQLYFDGLLDVSELSEWLSLDLQSVATGSAPVSGRVGICGARCTKLVVNSSLEGVTIDLPAPIGKTSDDVMSFQLVANPGGSNSLWRYNLGNQLRGATRLDNASDRTLIYLGGKRPEEPSKEGVHLVGSLPYLDLEQWRHSLSGLTASSQSIDGNGLPASFNAGSLSLSVDQIRYGNIEINDFDILATEKKGQLKIGFVSPAMTGSVVSPGQSKRQSIWSLNLNHINLDVLTGDESADKAESSNDAPISVSKAPDLTGWPDIDLSIDKLIWNQKTLGAWGMQLRPEPSGMSVQDIQGTIAGFTITGNAGWQGTDNTLNSFVSLSTEGDDLGRALTSLGYDNVLESGFAELSADFNWKGMPWDFSSRYLDGRYEMLLKKGRIIESGNSSNILRLFGILNFNTLARRLQLNFNDLVEKGVAYDRLYSRFDIKDGVMTTAEDLSLTGPSSDLKLRGEVDLPQQALNAEMDVVLPLTGNIPIAAVLMGAPQVAGVAFILDKLFGDKLQKVTTLRYQLNGPWASLNVVAAQPQSSQSPLQEP